MSAKKTAAKPAPAPAKAARTPLVDAPKPGVDPRDPSHLQDEDGDATSLADIAATTIASPPSPTNESALTANDAPGAGGLAAGEPVPQPRKRTALKNEKLVKVSVPKAFNLTLDDGSTVRYEAGTETMLEEHAEHWYAQANGVEIL